MSPRLWLAAPVLAASLLSAPGVRTSATATQNVTAATAQAAPSERASSLDDQIELAVTVYNSAIALVRDVRQIDLPRGVFDLAFQDIAATVNPATVHFRSLTEPARVGVLEQNYEYDLIEPDRSEERRVGRE